MRRIHFVVLRLLVVVLVIGAASKETGSKVQETSPAVGTPTDREAATAAAAGVPAECVAQSLGTPAGMEPFPNTAPQTMPSIVLFDLGYSPCAFSIPAGIPVTVALSNEGEAVGNLVIDALGVRSDVIAPGQTATVEIRAAPGVYLFYSDIPGHLEARQAGVLTVVGAGTTAVGTPTVATPISSLYDGRTPTDPPHQI